MRKDEDAFGQLLLDYLQGHEGDATLEGKDWSQPAMPASYFFAPIEDWEAYEREAIKLVKGRVLDIGCGAGRHSLYLQQRGHEVVAIDNSPGAVEVAKARGVLDVRLLALKDISPILGLFDSVLMMCGNFGLFVNKEDARRELRKLNAMTTEDAVILADTVDPYPSQIGGRDDTAANGDLAGLVRIRISYSDKSTPWYDLLNVSREEMADVVEGTGWHIEWFVPEAGESYIGVLKKD